MIAYTFTKQAEAEFLKLPPELQRRMLRKLEHFLAAPNPLTFAKRLVGTSRPSFRYQVGDYRIIFEWEGTHLLLLRIGHRREIYR